MRPDRGSYLVAFFSFITLLFLQVIVPLALGKGSESSDFIAKYRVVFFLVGAIAIAKQYGLKKGLAGFAITIVFDYLVGLDRYVTTAELQLAFLTLGLAYTTENFNETVLRRICGLRTAAITFAHAVGLFALIFGMLLVVVLISKSIAPTFVDSWKVREIVGGLPAYILVIAVFLAPISEEVFFRGFVATRFRHWIPNIIASSILFAAAHLLYGSAYEIFATFAIGLVLSIYFVKTRNLAACILAHFMFNGFSISVMIVYQYLLKSGLDIGQSAAWIFGRVS